MEGSLLFAPSNGSTEDPESVWRLKEKVLNLKKKYSYRTSKEGNRRTNKASIRIAGPRLYSVLEFIMSCS
jgi:hypothetical protein